MVIIIVKLGYPNYSDGVAIQPSHQEIAPLMTTVFKRASISLAAVCALTLSTVVSGPAAFADESADPTSSASTENCTVVPGEFSLAEGEMSWGIRSSFVNYIEKRARGTITQDGQAWNTGMGAFNFTANDGSFSVNGHQGTFNFGSSINFLAHGGALDITLSNFKIVSEGREVHVVVDAQSKGEDGSAHTQTGIALGKINGEHRHEGDKTIFENAPVVFTEAGASIFGSSYKAGDEMDNLNATLTLAPVKDCTKKPEGSPKEDDSTTQPTDPKQDNNKLPEENNNQDSDKEKTDQGSENSSSDDNKNPSESDNAGVNPAPNTPDKKDEAENSEVKPDNQVKELTAELNWGIRKSFLDYLAKPFVAAVIEKTDGVHGEFTFPLAQGQKLTREGLTKVNFAGKLHIQGHHGLLDLNFAEPTIEKTSTGWKLIATVASKPLAAGEAFRSLEQVFPAALPTPERLVIADLSAPVITTTGDITTYTFTTVELTDAGAAAFGGFYKPGDRIMDPIMIAIRSVTSTQPIPEQPQSPNTQPGADKNNDKPSDAPKNNDKAAGADKNANKPTAEKKPVKTCQVDPYKKRMTSGNLSWGLRDSFTSYIRGSIAKGGWNLNGVSWDGGAFNFPLAGGTYNTSTKHGTLYYSGSIHFYGHSGVLNLTMSNPAIEINGNSGDLYMTVNGTDMSGNNVNLGRVHFASISFGGVYANDSSFSFDGASVTLSSSGAQAFAGFYSAGEGLDSMSSDATMVPATACDPVTGELIEYNAFGENIATNGAALASTGTDAGALVALSLSILMLGAVAARRRQLM